MINSFYANPTADIQHSNLVTVDITVKRAHSGSQAQTVRTTVPVSKLEHLHFIVTVTYTFTYNNGQIFTFIFYWLVLLYYLASSRV